jgi:hydroxymethylpyrimidine/phosphomethylpyrimidine kinase
VLRLLTVAGTDSSGGAGVPADLKTFEAFGVFGMVAVTAVTAQNTLGVEGVWPLPPEAVAAQIRAVLSDIGVDAVKIGMLATRDLIATVADALEPAVSAGVPLVLDPVMQAKGGQALLAEDAVSALLSRLLPLATVVTPNLPEAERMTGRVVTTASAAWTAGEDLRGRGARWALIKGGHGSGALVTDRLVGPATRWVYRHVRMDTPHTHGTGCTLSSAIACELARGNTVPEAVGRATGYVVEAIREAPGLGQGRGPLNHRPLRGPSVSGAPGGVASGVDADESEL